VNVVFVLRKETSHKEFLSKISCKEALRRENIKTSLKKRTEDGDHINLVPVMMMMMMMMMMIIIIIIIFI
jgi:hypothetical protein